MRPAFSVLFLTTLIGIGQGVLIALVTGQFYFVIGSGAEQESGTFYAGGSAVALAFLAAGLVASVFHLANPQRGWRAAARWRTSWLSREVILLPAVMGLTVVYGALHWAGLNPVLMTFGNMKDLDLTMAAGFVAAGAAGLLFICTGMIYACVRFIPQWASSWTVINYCLMGLASGFAVAALYAALAEAQLGGFLAADALALTVAALLARGFQLWRNGRLKPSLTLKSAIGVHHNDIRQMSQGFMGGAFNTKEYFAPGGRETVAGLTVFALLCGFVLPAGLLLAGWLGDRPVLLATACISQYAGLLAERWVFFAAGRHVQNLYYQAKA